MADDRTIPASAQRLRRGWRAGVRVQSRWLSAAASTAAVGLALGAIPWGQLAGFGLRWRASVADPSRGAGLLLEALAFSASVAVSLVAAASLATVVTAAVVRGVGPIDARSRDGLKLGRRRGRALVFGLATVGGLLLASSLSSVMAGAARAVDATPAGLALLWSTWAGRTWTAVVAVLAALGAAEWALSSAQVRAMLARSPTQVREDARRGGGR